ncbi:hypothetical protein [Cloacibacillus sp.]|uniref:hypothetical protein n=1 Tax=Cloacibacillus sp. TaxID=2049023 RepID=UPI0025C1D8B2|nr:hypothetical protein [Cloacibacillus sp.]MCC8058212.1 hypothetical protein [Cloacibacillus sp.]
MMKVFFDKVKRAAALALMVTVAAAGSAAAVPRSPAMPPKNHGQMTGHPDQLPRHKPAPHIAPKPEPAPRRYESASGNTVTALAVGAVIGAVVGSLAANSK